MIDRGIRTAPPDPSARPKVIIGVALIILSFVLGKIAVPVIAIQPTLSLLIYAFPFDLCNKLDTTLCRRLDLRTGGFAHGQGAVQKI
jgi:hypothetical protein